LIEGRHFSEKEMIQITDTIPVIVANDIAEINALSVGSTFEAEQVIWKMVETTSIFTESGTSYSDDRTQSPFVGSYRFEVIGIFEILHSFNENISEI